MAVLVASMDSLLLSPFMGGAGDQFRYAYNNVAAHPHHHVVTESAGGDSASDFWLFFLRICVCLCPPFLSWQCDCCWFGAEDLVCCLFALFQGHTSCLDSDVEDDDEDDLTEDLVQAWKRSIGAKRHGCAHYRRRCKIRAPCCNEVFDCRHCHNDAKNINEKDDKKRHEIDRHQVKSVICSLCEHEQRVQQVCENCGVCMGEFFCDVCKFFDDDTSKQQYHCDKCGICRAGGRENFFHCDRCGCCYSTKLREDHICVEKSMHQDCPVCMEYLFDSIKDIRVLACGHTLHLECLQDMHKHFQFNCPLCNKSVCDMSSVWKQFDEEIAATQMPENHNRMVWVLCNDCGSTSEVQYHVAGQKCGTCPSYNTRMTETPTTLST